MKRLFPLLLIVVAFGCKSGAQIPPTSHSVTLTWTGPCTAGQTASQCGYVISSAVISGSSCPATTGTNYTPIQSQSAPLTATTYTDTSVTGKTVCYVAQTIEGGAVSNPSNTAGPFTVPANPTAPALNGTQASIEQHKADSLPAPDPQIAKVENLKAFVR